LTTLFRAFVASRPKRKGKKVTGLEFTPGGGEGLLVTTNDSRMRLYNMDDYSCICKFKGLVNENMQIQASFSQDGERIVSGSDNGQVYIWETRK
jgi:WD40 repeat protein